MLQVNTSRLHTLSSKGYEYRGRTKREVDRDGPQFRVRSILGTDSCSCVTKFPLVVCSDIDGGIVRGGLGMRFTEDEDSYNRNDNDDSGCDIERTVLC